MKENDKEMRKSLRESFEEWLEKHFGSPQQSQQEEPTEPSIPVKKAVEEELMQATYVALLAYPDDSEYDLHGDTYDADEVRKACHSFNKYCMKTNLGHLMMIDDNVASVIESYTSDVDMLIGEQFIPKGSWLQKWQFADGGLWEDVKKGLWNGISIGARANVEHLEENNSES